MVHTTIIKANEKIASSFFSLMLCRIVFQRKDRAAYIFITYNISGKIAMIKSIKSKFRKDKNQKKREDMDYLTEMRLCSGEEGVKKNETFIF